MAAGAAIVATAVLSTDLAGTTPWHGSYINTFHNEAHVDLVEERCTGAAECVQVCPRDVLAMNGHRRKVEIRRPEQCIQCGACIVQCPEDALRFRYDDGRIVEAATIRRTRMNMVGRRTVEPPEQ
jgi:NAD-dependent dihydropyrimidine dehydrogenase PreA subunit